jgi:hypothetical protein
VAASAATRSPLRSTKSRKGAPSFLDVFRGFTLPNGSVNTGHRQIRPALAAWNAGFADLIFPSLFSPSAWSSPPFAHARETDAAPLAPAALRRCSRRAFSSTAIPDSISRYRRESQRIAICYLRLRLSHPYEPKATSVRRHPGALPRLDAGSFVPATAPCPQPVGNREQIDSDHAGHMHGNWEGKSLLGSRPRHHAHGAGGVVSSSRPPTVLVSSTSTPPMTAGAIWSLWLPSTSTSDQLVVLHGRNRAAVPGRLLHIVDVRK